MPKELHGFQVKSGQGFVEIVFPHDIPRDGVARQVEECRSGRCSCCTPAFKEKVTAMELLPSQETTVRITGSISREEVMANLMACGPRLRGEG